MKLILVLLNNLPTILPLFEPILKFIKPKDKYRKERVVFILSATVLVIVAVSVLGEVNTLAGIEALEKLCEAVGCS